MGTTNTNSTTSARYSKQFCFVVIVIVVILSMILLSHSVMFPITRFLPETKYETPQSASLNDGNQVDQKNINLGTKTITEKGLAAKTNVSTDTKPNKEKTSKTNVSTDTKGNKEKTSKANVSTDTKTNKETTSTRKTNVSGVSVSGAAIGPKPLCPEKPVITDYKVALNLTEVTYAELAGKYGHVLQSGGHYSPIQCYARERMALIIPYRDRERNLHILLNNLIPFLIRQQADFTTFLVEQTPDYRFNRCLMFNVGFVESQKRGKFTCFIIHDTDLIPRDIRNLYRCHAKPRHLMLHRSNEHYQEKLPYATFIGGVLALRKEHMDKANGCSNLYYGWGLEDDDLGIRLRSRGFSVVRYSLEVGKYYSLGHDHQTDNPSRGKLRKTIRSRIRKEGLNTLTYTLVQQADRQIYTWLLVKPPPPPP